LPESDLRLRFSPRPPGDDSDDGGEVRLVIEEADGTPLGSETSWSAREPADAVLTRLATGLQRVGRYPGERSFDARAVFECLVRSLKLAVASRSEGRDRDLGRLTELAYGDWAITSKGFENISSDQPAASRSRIVSNPELALSKLFEQGVAPENPDELKDAFAGAVEYHRGEDRRRAISLVPQDPAPPPGENR
jgi:hypothetical protein